MGIDTNTPFYVLMDGGCRVGPPVVRSHLGIECSPIYGFSNRAAYNKFCRDSQVKLKPYPLVRPFLRSQVDSPGDNLKLVVIDAEGPHQRLLRAATMETVLNAHENKKDQLKTAYHLTLDTEDDFYRLESTVE